MQELICRALAASTDADIVLWGTEVLGGLAAGPVRYGDIVRAVPGRVDIAVVRLTPVELRAVLEENMIRAGDPGFLGIHGAHYTWLARREGDGVVDELVLRSGDRPHGRRRLSVALPAPLMVGEGPERSVLRAHAMDPLARIEVQTIDLRALVADYVSKTGLGDIRPGPGFSVVTADDVPGDIHP